MKSSLLGKMEVNTSKGETMAKAVLWVLEGEPKEVEIIDRNGERRTPNMEKVKSTPRLRGAYIAGSRFGHGVGNYFYGGRLGNKAELEARGNTYCTNDAILEAIGYKKTTVELD